jgi:hypothetical protein
MAFTVDGQAQTGVNRLAVKENRTGPAVAHIANFFSTRQGEIVTQRIEQRSPRF